MTTASRKPRRRGPRPLILVTLMTIVVAAVASVAITLASAEKTQTTSFDAAVSTVGGQALAPLPEQGDDPAVGQPAPPVKGQDRHGQQIAAPTTGRPTILLFLAHWCPHCRREVPAVQSWIDGKQLPAGVDLVAVATSIDKARPNYPTSAWLDRENWTPPTIADANTAAAQAYGLTAFPYWVAIDAQGRVSERATGELTLDQVTAMANRL